MGASLAISIGSLASAEERQLGTLEWQTLLPSPAWQQWAVKVSVTFGLALLLGVGLPALLHGLDGAKDYAGLQMWRTVVPLFVLLTAISLYLSTLCRTAVGALVVSFPTIAATFILGTIIRMKLAMFLAVFGRGRSTRPVQCVAAAAGDGCGARRAPALAGVPQSPDGGPQRGPDSEAGAHHRRLPHRLRPAPRRAGGALTASRPQCRAVP